MYEIRYSDKSIQDLSNITDYIRYTLKNPSAAKNIFMLIIKNINLSILFPFANPVVYISTNSIEYRVLKVKNYLIILTLDDQTIIVTRIIYSKRDWKNILD